MTSTRLKAHLTRAVSRVNESRQLGLLERQLSALELERPKRQSFGDLCSGIALKLSPLVELPAMDLAYAIGCELVASGVNNFEISPPGFINFTVEACDLAFDLGQIIASRTDYGRSHRGQGRKVLIRFVEHCRADLNVQARGLAYGNALANIFRFSGFEVRQEIQIDALLAQHADSMSERKRRSLLSNSPSTNDLANWKVASLADHPKKESFTARPLPDRLITILAAGQSVADLNIPAGDNSEPDLVSISPVKVVLKGQSFKVPLEQILEAIEVDVLRLALLSFSVKHEAILDLSLLGKASRQNPAFLIQYAYEKSCAVLKAALEPCLNLATGRFIEPVVPAELWQQNQNLYTNVPAVFNPLFYPQSCSSLTALIMRLCDLPLEMEKACLEQSPDRLTRYALNLAGEWLEFSEMNSCAHCSPEFRRAYLGLVLAVKQVMAQLLGVLGIPAKAYM